MQYFVNMPLFNFQWRIFLLDTKCFMFNLTPLVTRVGNGGRVWIILLI